MSYYAYHPTSYDQHFTSVVYLCWNLTNTKWLLPQLSVLYEKLNFSYDGLLPEGRVWNTPLRFVDLDGDVGFLRETEDYWIGTVPMTIIGFGLVNFAGRTLRKSKHIIAKTIAKLLKRFMWVSFLTMTLIGDNLQYFSFKCFAQMYELSARLPVEFFGLVLTYTVLFVVVFYAVSSGLLVMGYHSEERELVCENFNYSFGAGIHLTLIGIIRVFNGVVHSRMDEFTRILTLLTVRIVQLCLIIKNRSYYTKKIVLLCHIS